MMRVICHEEHRTERMGQRAKFSFTNFKDELCTMLSALCRIHSFTTSLIRNLKL